MSYSDAELVMATQLAYLDFDGNSYDSMNAGELVDSILQQYGTYDSSTGTWTVKDGVSAAAGKQFDYAQQILTLSEENNVDSWRNWTIVDSCNNETTSGYYACLIDTGDGSAIVGCRGSESYDLEQKINDWVQADFGRLNNELTDQQADATEYMEYLYQKYGDDYDTFCITGHSLGGSLAMHSAITAPEGMQDKIDQVVSYDGPGFSDEYLDAHADQIDRVKDKMTHYEYSLVGSLLLQPDGTNNVVIQAHDDPNYDGLSAQLNRHSVTNIEFDENGNVIEGERTPLMENVREISLTLELFPTAVSTALTEIIYSTPVLFYIAKTVSELKQELDEVVTEIKAKISSLYDSFISLVVSGEYEIHASEIGSMADDLEAVRTDMQQIEDQIDAIRKNLPYDSVSAIYYKNCLRVIGVAMSLDCLKAKAIAHAAETAVSKYNQSDRKVSTCF
ncbi:MAG: DUF2974 domain-containing protein [Lachnospiraceae bacterium]|nr:DUF2974 domain-containing protein [Lachnospiraceae bacterium]